jgi:hypothetical protein
MAHTCQLGTHREPGPCAHAVGVTEVGVELVVPDREPGPCAHAVGVTEVGVELVVPDREPGPCAHAVGVTEVGVESHARSVCQRVPTVPGGYVG